jgi:hypothetical protein
MEYMETIDQILFAEYLFRASPETVYEWFKSLPKRSPDDICDSDDYDDYKKIESKLLGRKDEIVDLALAAWGRNANTTDALYERWCTSSVVPEWPPKPSTYPHTILAALLANENANILLPSRGFNGRPVKFKDELNWIFENGDDGGLFYLAHKNIALGLSLLQSCVEKKGPYARVSDSLWLGAIVILANNKALHRLKSKYTAHDGIYSDTHRLLIKAAEVSPKTLTGADVIGRLFAEHFQIEESQDVCGGKELDHAINAWNVEISDAAKSNHGFSSWLEYSNEIDAMAPAERVQFHLLRHYRSYLDLDPDDPIRVNRLAAYALNRVNGGQRWNLGSNPDNRHTGKGLDKDSFQRYAERDGAAFMYANSFNEDIWGDDAIAELLRGSSWRKASYEYPYPDKKTAIYLNRAKAKKRADVNQTEESKEYDMESHSFEQQVHASIAKVSEELTETRKFLINDINALGNRVFTGVILVVVLLMLLFIFKH